MKKSFYIYRTADNKIIVSAFHLTEDKYTLISTADSFESAHRIKKEEQQKL